MAGDDRHDDLSGTRPGPGEQRQYGGGHEIDHGDDPRGAAGIGAAGGRRQHARQPIVAPPTPATTDAGTATVGAMRPANTAAPVPNAAQ